MNKKGFTIIELLVAFVILFVLMAGFLRGILLYMDYQINNGLKNKASEIAFRISSQIQTAPFNPTAECDRNNTNPFLCDTSYAYHYDWNSAQCDGGNCTFEVQDSDGDGIADFYDPYNGPNENFSANPTNTARWLRIIPCNCDGNRCDCCYADSGTQINAIFTCGERHRGRFIYAGTTLARLVDPVTNLEMGRVAGVIVWYFDTKGRYKYVSLPVVRDTR